MRVLSQKGVLGLGGGGVVQLLNEERFSLHEMLSMHCDSAPFNGKKKIGYILGS